MKDKTCVKTVCPKCGEVYSGYPALSRENNRTLICPECGTKEALAPLAICEDDREYILGIIHTHSN